MANRLKTTHVDPECQNLHDSEFWFLGGLLFALIVAFLVAFLVRWGIATILHEVFLRSFEDVVLRIAGSRAG